MKKRIVLTGGGTGGHIIPLVTVVRAIRKKLGDDKARFYFLGPRGKIEKTFFEAENIPIIHVAGGKFRRYASFGNIIDIFKVPIGVIQSLWILLKIMPDAVFSKGGYASLPVIIAAWIYRIPIIIHESDAIPGLANRIVARFSNRIAVGFELATQYFSSKKTVVTGNPVRKELTEGSAERARERYHLSESKPVIFVSGGSQGARQINVLVTEILPELLFRYQVIHQTGEKTYGETIQLAHQKGIKEGHEGYIPLKFIGEELGDILAVADLVISRAGASSIAELAAVGKPSVVIPLENAANDHQRINAHQLEKTGSALVVESNLGTHVILEKINALMDSQETREKLAERINAFYYPDAAEKIAEGVIGMM